LSYEKISQYRIRAGYLIKKRSYMLPGRGSAACQGGSQHKCNQE